ncbi:hypothetical protein KR200_010481 [Drosophila serrata]|nr:hypothetical protein KR200_010481 [Drosophila serrata]
MENSKNEILPVHGTDPILESEDRSDSPILSFGSILVPKKEKPDDDELRQVPVKIKEQDPQAAVAQKRKREEKPKETTRVPEHRIDEKTISGHFGWEELESSKPELAGPNLKVIPYFYRNLEKFCAESMLKVKLRNFPLHPNIAKCGPNVRKYKILASEIKLINEINSKHCNGQFGGKLTQNEFLMTLRDALDCYQFRSECYRMLTSDFADTPQNKCGFIHLSGGSFISYIVVNGRPVVPLSYIKDVPDEVKAKSQVVRGWDLSYLKFCALVEGSTANTLAIDSMTVIPLEDAREKLNEEGEIEYYWPSSDVTSEFLADYQLG